MHFLEQAQELYESKSINATVQIYSVTTDIKSTHAKCLHSECYITLLDYYHLRIHLHFTVIG